MKPGNRQMYGANSCRIGIPGPERWGSNKKAHNSFVRRSFQFFAAKEER